MTVTTQFQDDAPDVDGLVSTYSHRVRATAGTVTTLVAGPAGFNALPGAFASLAVVTILYAVDRVAVRRMER